MVLAGLGDAWIRFLGARDSARLAPRHSQRTQFTVPRSHLPPSPPPPRHASIALVCRGIWTCRAATARRPSSTCNQEHVHACYGKLERDTRKDHGNADAVKQPPRSAAERPLADGTIQRAFDTSLLVPTFRKRFRSILIIPTLGSTFENSQFGD